MADLTADELQNLALYGSCPNGHPRAVRVRSIGDERQWEGYCPTCERYYEGVNQPVDQLNEGVRLRALGVDPDRVIDGELGRPEIGG